MSTGLKQFRASAKSQTQFIKLHIELLADTRIGPAAKIIMAILRDRVDQNGLVELGVHRMATLAGISEKSARRALAKLRAVKLLTVQHSALGRRNRYQLSAYACNPGQNDQPNPGQNDQGEQPQPRSKRPGGPVKMTAEARSKRPPVQTTDFLSDIQCGKGGKPKSSSVHQELVTYFCDEWAARVGQGAYQFSGGRDGKVIQQLLAATNGDVDRGRRIIISYLNDPDAYVVQRGHPLGLLIPRLPQYLAATARRPDAGQQSPAESDHPIIILAKRKWPADLAAHRAAYHRIVERAEAGDLPYTTRKQLETCETGAEFRRRALEEARRSAS